MEIHIVNSQIHLRIPPGMQPEIPQQRWALLAPFQQELDERDGNAYELRRNSGGETPQTG